MRTSCLIIHSPLGKVVLLRRHFSVDSLLLPINSAADNALTEKKQQLITNLFFGTKLGIQY